MPKLDLTNEEITQILEGLHLLEKSAERSQKSGRTPHIKEVYEIHKRSVQAIAAKVGTAK